MHITGARWDLVRIAGLDVVRKHQWRRRKQLSQGGRLAMASVPLQPRRVHKNEAQDPAGNQSILRGHVLRCAPEYALFLEVCEFNCAFVVHMVLDIIIGYDQRSLSKF